MAIPDKIKPPTVENRTFDETKVGVRVPLILTSRANKALSRMTSSAVVLMLAHDRRQQRP